MSLSETLLCPTCRARLKPSDRQCHACGALIDFKNDVPEDWLGVHVDGKYIIEQILGVGGMGMVFSARRSLVGDRVALKILYPRLMQSKLQRRLFADEAVAAARLSHRNVVTVFDADVSETLGIAYIAMELLEGTTLKTVLRECAPMKPDELMPIAAEICHGLSAAHQAKIIHRDLKPDNIFLETLSSGQRRVKLVDFGIAAMLDESHEEDKRQRIGTLRYMAPEQCMGEAIDARADLYALGVILYEGFTRKRATGKGVDDIRFEVPKLPNRHLPKEASLPVGLEDLLVRLLAKHPQDRPPSAKTAATFLARLQESPDVAFEDHEVASPLSPVMPSPRILLSTTGLISVIAGICMGMLVWFLT